MHAHTAAAVVSRRRCTPRLINSYLPTHVGEKATKFAELNRPVLVDIARLDELGELLFCGVLTKLLQHRLQFTASYVAVLVHIEFVKNNLEGSSFIVSHLRLGDV